MHERLINTKFSTSSVVWHHSLPLMNSFNKTEAAVFSCRLCFLRVFPFISLISLFQQSRFFAYYFTCKYQKFITRLFSYKGINYCFIASVCFCFFKLYDPVLLILNFNRSLMLCPLIKMQLKKSSIRTLREILSQHPHGQHNSNQTGLLRHLIYQCKRSLCVLYTI